MPNDSFESKVEQVNRFFPAADSSWTDVLAFLRRYAGEDDRILAPREFLEELHQVYGYGILHAFPLAFHAFVVLHKGMYEYFPTKMLVELDETFTPVFANEVFIVFSARPLAEVGYEPDVHYRAFAVSLAKMKEGRQVRATPAHPGPKEDGGCGVVVTTYNRPDALERSLPQIAAAGRPFLVVDDGSDEAVRSRNRETAFACGARYLLLPENRGLAAALAAGVSYWLADPDVSWISCFQDDVDVHPRIFSILGKVQDSLARPILTGRLSRLHPVFGRERVNGEEIVFMRSVPGVHYHACRDYWQGVLPVPAPYLGAPKPGQGLAGQGSEEDHWISAWSPASVTKRGGFVACLPGLVRTFLVSAKTSTWNHECGEEDGPLRGDKPDSPPEGRRIEESAGS